MAAKNPTADTEQTTLEQFADIDDRLHFSVHPGATLTTSNDGDRSVELVAFETVDGAIGLDDDFVDAGIVRAARYEVTDEHVVGVVGETANGELFELRRRDDDLKKIPATLTSPALGGA